MGLFDKMINLFKKKDVILPEIVSEEEIVSMLKIAYSDKITLTDINNFLTIKEEFDDKKDIKNINRRKEKTLSKLKLEGTLSTSKIKQLLDINRKDYITIVDTLKKIIDKNNFDSEKDKFYAGIEKLFSENADIYDFELIKSAEDEIFTREIEKLEFCKQSIKSDENKISNINSISELNYIIGKISWNTRTLASKYTELAMGLDSDLYKIGREEQAINFEKLIGARELRCKERANKISMIFSLHRELVQKRKEKGESNI